VNFLKTKVILLLGMLTALLLAACGGASSSGKTTVTLLTWENTATNAAIDQALQQFQKDNPNIVIQHLESPNSNYADKLSSLTQARKLPDLFWCGNDTEQQYTSQGLLHDYSAQLKSANGDFTANNFVQIAIQNWTTSDGKIGGLPSLMNTYGIWYNADAFTTAGLTTPAAGWTWDDMYHDAQVLTSKSGSTTSYGLIASSQLTKASDGPFTMSTYALSAGGQPFADKINNPTKITADAKYVEGVTKLATAIQGGSVAPPGYNDSNAASSFSAGKVPMLMAGQWLAAGFLQNKPSVKYGFAPLPIATGGQPATLFDAVGICTPSYTQTADATWKVMQYLDSKAWESVLPSAPVAPPAYQPSATPYYNTLHSGNLDSVVTTVTDTLKITNVNGVRFTTSWASKANDIATAYWPDILAGKKPISELQTMVNQLNALVKSNG